MADSPPRLAPVEDPDVIARVVAVLVAHRPERRKAEASVASVRDVDIPDHASAPDLNAELHNALGEVA